MCLRRVAGAPLLSGRSSSITFLERLLSSEHRTADPEEADYFFMPMVGGYMPVRRIRFGRRENHSLGNRLAAIDFVKAHPRYRRYWARKGGADHIAIGVDDSGARAYFHGAGGEERQDHPDAMKIIFLSHMVRPDRYDSPRHPTHVEPSCLELDGIL